jgi:hypothetical protein
VLRPGGVTIAEVLRHAWSRLIRKQWLILYPLALAVIHTLAFLAIYASNGGALNWTAFFTANANRWEYVQDRFLTPFSFTPTLGVAIFAGLSVCVLAAMIRAPYFRAIASLGYPLAPRRREDAARLSLFYVLANLVVWVLPLAVPTGSPLTQIVAFAVLVVAILIAFVDYIIVFEEMALLPAIRRSIRLFTRRWITVVVIFVVIQLIYLGIYSLYDLYYQKATRLFILLPVSQMLVEAFVVLCVDLVLIFLYEQIRRQSVS